MKPLIENTQFGAITISGVVFERDVIIRLDGRVKKRRKKLSKAVYGTSHVISRAEAEHVFEKGAQRLIVGTGQHGAAEMSDEAAAFLERQNCEVVLLPTGDAAKAWNESGPGTIALFHVTC